MNIYKIIKEELDNIIKEDITSGSTIVYHRTGKGGESPVEGITADGYRVGAGAYYGVGVYTTYNLESQTKNSDMISTYGNIIIESKVLSLDKFLIFDYNIAKRIYGNKNYTLDKQLQIILGKEYNKYKDNEKLIDILENVEYSYSSHIAKDFYNLFKNTIIKNVRGLVFTGETDGNVLLSYDRKNVEPLRYTTDEGETWTNITNKTVYGRVKGYNPEESNIEIEHIKNKLDTGRQLDDNEIDIILNNQEILSKIGGDNINNIISSSSEPDKIINIILNNKELFSKINNNIINVIYKSSERDKIFKKLLLNNEILVSKLDYDSIGIILLYSSEPDKVIDIILNNEILVSKIRNYNISTIISNSSEPEKVKTLLKKIRPDLFKESKMNIYNVIKEEIYNYNNLDDNRKDNIYNLFKSSYEKTLGTSWSKDKFNTRAYNWLFYGDDNGFVAVRPQRSGFQKLVGVGGNAKSILKGLDELNSQNLPIWGMVSSDIQKLMNKKGFITPPAMLLKLLFKIIPKEVFGGSDFVINKDGSITLNYEDVGQATKYFIANKLYFKQLKKDSWHLIEEKLKTLPAITKNILLMFFKNL